MIRTMPIENRPPAPDAETAAADAARLPRTALFEGAGGLQETVRFFERLGGTGLWSWRMSSRAMEWSRGVFDLLDIEPGSIEPSFQQLLAMMHPEDRLRDAEIEALVARGLPIDRQFRVILGTGRLRALEIKGEVLFDSSGKPQRAVGLLRDVTAREEALRLAGADAARYRALRDLVGDLFVLTRADGTVIEGPNGRGAAALDAPRAASWLDAVHPEDAGAALSAWKQAAAHRAPFAAELRIAGADGAPRHVALRGEPIRAEDGSLREWMIVFTDAPGAAARSAGADAMALTGAQIRAARAILNWSVRDLSDASGVSISTIRRMEEFDGTLTTLKGRLGEIKATLERCGVEFVAHETGKPGVRPR